MRDLDWVLEAFGAVPAAWPVVVAPAEGAANSPAWTAAGSVASDFMGKDKDSLVETDDVSRNLAADESRRSNGVTSGAVALAMTPINAIKDVFLRHREKLNASPSSYSMHQMEILRSICNMVIKICTLYRIDPLSKILKRHQQFIGDATRFLKTSEQEFAGGSDVCTSTEERYYKLVYTYQSVALLPIVAPPK